MLLGLDPQRGVRGVFWAPGLNVDYPSLLFYRYMTNMVKNAKPIDHTKKPCVDVGFIPDTVSVLYVVYIKCPAQHITLCTTWLEMAKCYKIWDQNVRGYHQGSWRLWIKGNHVVVVSSLSPYFVHKPKHLVPVELKKT